MIYWQYAKVISASAGMGKKQYSFIMNKFKKLQREEIFWNEIREYIKERERPDTCSFCSSIGVLSLEHLYPRVCNGPDDEKNVVWVCRRCNSSKGGLRPYEYWASHKGGMEAAKYEMPRVAEGKYLKFLFEVLSDSGLIDMSRDRIREEICPRCDLSSLCEKEGTLQELSPLCLDAVARRALAR